MKFFPTHYFVALLRVTVSFFGAPLLGLLAVCPQLVLTGMHRLECGLICLNTPDILESSTDGARLLRLGAEIPLRGQLMRSQVRSVTLWQPGFLLL